MSIHHRPVPGRHFGSAILSTYIPAMVSPPRTPKGKDSVDRATGSKRASIPSASLPCPGSKRLAGGCTMPSIWRPRKSREEAEIGWAWRSALRVGALYDRDRDYRSNSIRAFAHYSRGIRDWSYPGFTDSSAFRGVLCMTDGASSELTGRLAAQGSVPPVRTGPPWREPATRTIYCKEGRR